ncbi:bifunctional phosphopantothenoylcysteine decarboxylase/phosphopantothenate--cysteine ligase CoaBC, partial [candidate division CSSED10-310 bacterium]
MTLLRGKKIVLGVSGGIAAYKAIEILRGLQKSGATVQVVMTANATRFITPLTCSILTGSKVYVSMFPEGDQTEIEHIALGEKLDLFLIAPATANIIGKMARGIADDFVSTFYLSSTAPIVLAPAMNWKMYDHAAVQENLDLLASRGAYIIEPEEGDLACRDIGKGRLASSDRIVDKVMEILTPKTLKGK